MPSVVVSVSRFALIAATIMTVGARANEGFWPLNRLPLDRIRQGTGVSLQPDFLARALRSTLRTPGWCTSVFVSIRSRAYQSSLLSRLPLPIRLRAERLLCRFPG